MFKSQGVTLLEVLVALFIFSIGLLALAKLQHTSWEVLIRAGEIDETNSKACGLYAD